jgi:hypothetical protein
MELDEYDQGEDLVRKEGSDLLARFSCLSLEASLLQDVIRASSQFRVSDVEA